MSYLRAIGRAMSTSSPELLQGGQESAQILIGHGQSVLAFREYNDVMRGLLADIHRHEVDAAVRVALAVGLPLLALDAVGPTRSCRLCRIRRAGIALRQWRKPRSSAWRRRLSPARALSPPSRWPWPTAAAQAPVPLLGVLLAVTVIGAGTLGAVMRWVPRGEMFFVLVLLVIADVPTSWDRLPLGIAVGAGGAALSVLLAVLNCIGAREGEPREEPKTDGWRRRIASGYTALDRRRHLVLIAAATLGVLAAWLLALALGVGHPFWAAVTVAGADAGARRRRRLAPDDAPHAGHVGGRRCGHLPVLLQSRPSRADRDHHRLSGGSASSWCRATTASPCSSSRRSPSA